MGAPAAQDSRHAHSALPLKVLSRLASSAWETLSCLGHTAMFLACPAWFRPFWVGDMSQAYDYQPTLGWRCPGKPVGPDTISRYQEVGLS